MRRCCFDVDSQISFADIVVDRTVTDVRSLITALNVDHRQMPTVDSVRVATVDGIFRRVGRHMSVVQDVLWRTYFGLKIWTAGTVVPPDMRLIDGIRRTGTKVECHCITDISALVYWLLDENRSDTCKMKQLMLMINVSMYVS